mgnify:FL=1
MRRYYRGCDMQRILSVAEMASLARHRLPGFAWEYLQGGAEDEMTLQRNRAIFNRYELQGRTLVPNDPPELATTLVGTPSRLPMAIGPSGFNGMLWPGADIELARTAAAQGIPFTLSTVANASMEDVRAQVPDVDLWFQLYALKAPELEKDLLDRAIRSGCSTLVVTSDALVVGNREWDRRNFASPRDLTLRNKLDVLAHPGWLWRPGGLPTMGNLDPYLPEGESTALGAMQFIAEQLDTRLDWTRLAAIRARWPGKIILKGVMHPDDALAAIALGLDGLVISNHGGRQLDGVCSSLEALARIAPLAEGKISLLLDSGIRRGADIVKALALGAEGVLLARATLYGVAAGGASGAGRVLDILDQELVRCLNLMGCTGIAALDKHWLHSNV